MVHPSNVAFRIGADGRSCDRMASRMTRVLVVDDDPAFGRLTELLLLEGFPGADVATAGSLGEALVDAAAIPPGCVLLDLSLPDAEGLDAITRLRAAGVLAPLVVLTGRTDTGIERDARDRGADGYLVKGDGGLIETVAAFFS